ncbi:hypothetical protein [Amycolatopsis tolypomycina]|uniref:hypothetical protein n=1 Tax=Amycolatopsis tolypomycina TaxID=208445 RepID=UPI0033BC058E
MNVNLSVDETKILIAAIVRAKFDNPDAFEPYFGSSVLAGACARLVESLMSTYEEAGDTNSIAAWKKWEEWSRRGFEKDAIVRHASLLPAWSEWNRTQKFDALGSFCSPFRPSSSDLDEMIENIDEIRQGL